MRFWRKAMRSFRAGELGDAAVYKSISGGVMAAPEVERQLAARPKAVSNLVLANCADGSLGAAYVAFMQQHGLQTIRPSEALLDSLAPSHYLAARYVVLHDVFHVLLGFDTSPAGELGVYAFVDAQGYSPQLSRAYRVARVFYRLTSWRWSQLKAAEQRGKALAAEAKLLIALPLEDWLTRPLDEVRRECSLSAVAA